MPVILPEGLASAPLLRAEGIEVLHRPPRGSSTLRVGLLNLMPDKTGTEMQFARLLGATRHHVELVPALPSSHRSGREATRLYARWGETSLPVDVSGYRTAWGDAAPTRRPALATVFANSPLAVWIKN